MPFNVSFRLDDRPTIEDVARQHASKTLGHQWVPVYPRSGTLILTPVEEQRATEAVKEGPPADWEALAVGMLVKNPEWSVQQVADCVGVHRGTLYRSRLFKAFRDRIRAAGKQELLADLPRGTKEVDHDDKRAGARLEACERDDDEESEQEG
jgi:hypothetical protein